MMLRNPWKSVALVAIMATTALILAGCPETSRRDGTSTESETSLPLREIPGTYLIYTVNDFQLDIVANKRTAHVLISATDGSRRDILMSFSGFIHHMVPSPDGTRLAIAAQIEVTDEIQEGIEETHLFIYEIDTGGMVDVSLQDQRARRLKTGPIFTSDGSKVLFLSRWARDVAEFYIFSCDIVTLQISPLYTEPLEDVPLMLIPGGGQVVAVRRSPDLGNSFEFVGVEIETGASEILHTFQNVTKIGPAHVNEDHTVLYCDVKPIESEAGFISGIRSRKVVAVDLLTGSERILLDPASVSYVYQLFRDSEGNDNLVLRRQEKSPDEDTLVGRVAIYNVATSGLQYLSPIETRTSWPVPPSNIRPLSPDGTLLYYYQKDPVFEYTDIYVMHPDGSDPVNLSNTAGYNEGSAGWIAIR